MKHRMHIAEYVARWDAQHMKSITPEQRVPRCVAPRLVAVDVRFAIDFDNQPPLKTGKVRRHSVCRKLAAEFVAARTFPQRLPKQDLRQAHFPPQRACALHLLDRCPEHAWAPSTAFHAVPLPVPGRIMKARPCHGLTS